MALRMAENSLFAILLRSNWWYSAALGLIVVVLATAIAPRQFLVVGLSLSLPFFGISVFAAFKQLQRPSSKRVLEVAAQARAMSAVQVAGRISDCYTAERFESETFKGNDADLQLTRGYRKLLLSTRRFKAATAGVEPLKLLVKTGEAVEATGYLYVTLGDVSASALHFAKQHDIEIIRATELAAYFDGKAVIE